MRRTSTLLLASTIMLVLAAGSVLARAPVLAGPKPPTRTRLECKVALGPEAAGMVRYEVDQNGTRLLVAIESAAELPTTLNPIVQYQAGESIDAYLDQGAPGLDPPETRQDYLLGSVVLIQNGTELEGSLKREAKTRVGAPSRSRPGFRSRSWSRGRWC